jgi:hypothetical protein
VLTTMGDVVVPALSPGPLPTKADYAYRFALSGAATRAAATKQVFLCEDALTDLCGHDK